MATYPSAFAQHELDLMSLKTLRTQSWVGKEGIADGKEFGEDSEYDQNTSYKILLYAYMSKTKDNKYRQK